MINLNEIQHHYLDRSMVEQFTNQDKKDGVKKAWYYYHNALNCLSACDTVDDVKAYIKQIEAHCGKAEILKHINLDIETLNRLGAKKGRCTIYTCPNEVGLVEIATIYGRVCGSNEFSLLELIY